MPTVFLDRDGVINQNIENGYVTSWDRFRWLPGSVESISILCEQGWNVFIVTNQACIGKGIVNMNELSEIHDRMQEELLKYGAKINQFYVCPHKPEDNCDCRKPKPGMLLRAAEEHRLNLSSCYFIGDSITDMMAAHSVGCTTVLVRTGLGERYENDTKRLGLADYYCNGVVEAVQTILRKESVLPSETFH
ncbi:D-glycero-beta-D-manno-heptose 1,7-bisphosphate 7-phosphatase [Paenibacillus sp. NPDC058071]|uniref:D-glycero-beta-D-manno-heptose 1,7-bisphosphate 7-phosphatase n=1 Tax=Paenibacillus sp. NPDC058071 TaxID=3346326 RepID=UPI0036DA9615